MDHAYRLDFLGELFGRIRLEFDSALRTFFQLLPEVLEGAKPGMVFRDEQASAKQELGFVGRLTGPRAKEAEQQKDVGDWTPVEDGAAKVRDAEWIGAL